MYYFSVSVYTVFSVPLTAVCIFDWNLPSKNFRLCLFSRNLKGYLTELLFFGDVDSEASCRSLVFVRAITMWLVISPSASLPTYNGTFGRFGAVAKQAVQSFTLCSISFRNSGHQNIFASDSIFVIPE